ncbi:MAG TPA: hypothetical protein VH120_01725, partial [Gemmataceae bacterium]|nr:hypothetical protein [Gemmataceae bacterium]
MGSMTVSWIVFAIVFGGALVGMALRALLPEHHTSQDSKDAVKLGMCLVGTMSALVLGLLIASAKSSFDAQRNGVSQLSANVILLDRILAHYGPAAKDCRDQLRQNVTTLIDGLWPVDHDHEGLIGPSADAESLYERIQGLSPQTDAQRSLQASALKTGVDIAQARWLLFAQAGSSIPVPFLVVLVFWLSLLFASFSLFARPNTTVFTALLLSALSVAGA